MATETRRFKVVVDHWKRVPTDDGLGTKAVPLPSTEETVAVEIDWDAIARELGRKAAKNRSKKSVEMGGLVIVRIVGVGRVIGPEMEATACGSESSDDIGETRDYEGR